MTDTLLDNIEALCILLVDDDPFMQRIIEKVLKDLGFENIKKANDGQEALEVLGQGNIDLLLTDIQMPNMNGLELMKTIRCGNSSVARDLRTIIITSFSNTETLGSSMALDVNGFLTKPFKPVTVMKTIMQAFAEEGSELRSEESYLEVKTDLSSLGEDESTSPETTTEESSPEDNRNQCINIHQLQPGMRLTKDVKTEKGVLLLSAGFVLNKNTISRLFELGDVITEHDYHVEDRTSDQLHKS